MKNKIFYLIAILLLACKNEKTTTIILPTQDIDIKVIFPDTVFINELYNGKIKYKNVLDTITTV